VDDPLSSRLFVADRSNSDAAVLSAGSTAYVAHLALPFPPAAVADDPARGLVYFASDSGGVAAYFATNLTPAGTWNVSAPAIALNASFEGLVVDPASGAVVLLTPDLAPSGVSGAWVLTPSNGSTRFVPLGGAGAGALGDFPTAAAFDPLDGDVYVARTGGTVDVLNLTNGSVLASASVATRPSYLVFDAVPGIVVLADGVAGTLRLLNGSAPASVGAGVLSVPVGPDPEGLTVDPGLHQLVVSDYGSATLDAFSTVPEVGSLTVHVTIPTVGERPGVTAVDDVGRPVLLDALAGGGSGPVRFAYSGLPTGCFPANTSHLFCQPTGAGVFSPNVTVTDAASRTASAGTTLTVEPAPSVSATATPDPVDGPGATVNVTATIHGGVGPVQYAVGFGDGTAPVDGPATSNRFSVAHSYIKPGSYSATVSVTDSFGSTNATSVPIVIGVPLAGVASVGPVPLGGPTYNVTFSAQVSGGVGPYTFSWVFAGGVRVTGPASAENRSTTVETFDHTGPETVQVWLNDSANGSLRLYDNTTVLPPPVRLPPPNLFWLVVPPLLAAAVAVGAFLGWRTLRRRKNGEPPVP
jgi:hypothetical protein